MLRSYLAFDAPPTDHAQTPDGPPPGRRYMAALLEEVRGSVPVVEELDQHSSYGWSFTVRDGEVDVWCMLQVPGYTPEVEGKLRWLVLTEPRQSVWRRLFRPRSALPHRQLCVALDRAIRGLPDVTAVRWHTHDEYAAGEQGGADHPVEGPSGATE